MNINSAVIIFGKKLANDNVSKNIQTKIEYGILFSEFYSKSALIIQNFQEYEISVCQKYTTSSKTVII